MCLTLQSTEADVNYAQSTGTIGRSGGHSDMFSEMAKKLERRRLLAEGEQVSDGHVIVTCSLHSCSWWGVWYINSLRLHERVFLVFTRVCKYFLVLLESEHFSANF